MPLGGAIELTARCNLRCRHCHISRPVDDPEALGSELTTEQWCDVIDQIADHECLWLLLTGGEPLVRGDFEKIYRHAKKKGLIVTLFTNGTMLDERMADFLADHPPHSIEITVYGRSEKTYEVVTGLAGSYRRSMTGIELLLERKLPLKLKTMVLTLNKHELWQMKSFAQELGVDFRFDPVLLPRFDGRPAPERFRITPEEIVELDLADSDRTREWQDFCRKFCGVPPESDLLYRCGAGMESFHVDFLGLLTPCMTARSKSYDLRQGTFPQGWDTFLPEVLSEKVESDVVCNRCPLLALCDNCPGWSHLARGNVWGPIDYLCRTAHLRFEAFGSDLHSKDIYK